MVKIPVAFVIAEKPKLALVREAPADGTFLISRYTQAKGSSGDDTTTLDLYSHVTDTMQSDAAVRLDAALRLVINPAASSI